MRAPSRSRGQVCSCSRRRVETFEVGGAPAQSSGAESEGGRPEAERPVSEGERPVCEGEAENVRGGRRILGAKRTSFFFLHKRS